MKIVILVNFTVPAVYVYHGILPVMEYGIVKMEQTNQAFVATCSEVFESYIKQKLYISYIPNTFNWPHYALRMSGYVELPCCTTCIGESKFKYINTSVSRI
jgi:hypothetical protein